MIHQTGSFHQEMLERFFLHFHVSPPELHQRPPIKPHCQSHLSICTSLNAQPLNGAVEEGLSCIEQDGGLGWAQPTNSQVGLQPQFSSPCCSSPALSLQSTHCDIDNNRHDHNVFAECNRFMNMISMGNDYVGLQMFFYRASGLRSLQPGSSLPGASHLPPWLHQHQHQLLLGHSQQLPTCLLCC